MTRDSLTGRTLVQRLRRRARVGDEPQLHLVDAVRTRDDERIADPQRVGGAGRAGAA